MHAIDHCHESLQRYKDFRPTGFDRVGLNADRLGIADWWVAPCTQTRDSGVLAQSNFLTIQRLLDDAGVEYETRSFGHWACGWFEIIVVKPGDKAETVLGEIVRALEDYPVLDEDDYGQAEYEAALYSWQWTDLRERIRICHKHGVSIFAARRDEIPSGLDHWEDFHTRT